VTFRVQREYLDDVRRACTHARQSVDPGGIAAATGTEDKWRFASAYFNYLADVAAREVRWVARLVSPQGVDCRTGALSARIAGYRLGMHHTDAVGLVRRVASHYQVPDALRSADTRARAGRSPADGSRTITPAVPVRGER
jgi:hypothetical protein